MSNHKRLSQLSFAAAALLAAAIPSLAQTESRQTEALNLAPTTEIAVLRNEPLTVSKAAPKTSSEAKVNKTAAPSRDKLNSAIAQVTSNPTVFSNSTTISESDWQKTRRVANDDDSSSSKRITFVPSRGQKLPE